MADLLGKSLINGEEEEKDRLEEAKKELQSLKLKVKEADDAKARLILEKMDEEDVKDRAKHDMMSLAEKLTCRQKEFSEGLKSVQEEALKVSNNKQDLMDKLRRYQEELEAKTAEASRLKQKFKISTQIPETEVKFLHQYSGEEEEEQEEEEEEEEQEQEEQEEEKRGSAQPIRGVFTISQQVAVHLKGGQALVTFEEEKVASQILKMSRCLVSCENSSMEVKPKPVSLDPAVKFEVHLHVSRKELKVSGVPASLPEDRTKDRLELSFSKPSRGGGEVEEVDYDDQSGTATVTFLNPGVSERLALEGRYNVDLDQNVVLKVGPSFSHKLHKFQTFCSSTKRTVLLDDIQDTEEEEDMQDFLQIHFQKPSNNGGEIENIKYISRGKDLQAIFREDLIGKDN